MQEESVFLRFKSGGSDKAYNAHLKQDPENPNDWTVHFSYGRYGHALKNGSKTTSPVSCEKAKAIYDKLVNSKTAKGYSPEKNGAVFAGTKNADRVTGFQPQLLNAITLEDMRDKIASEPGQWIAQEKFDGERRGLKMENGRIIASNRRGLEVSIPENIRAGLVKLTSRGLSDFEIDCEDMGDYIVPFDMLSFRGKDLRNEPTGVRLNYLGKEFHHLCVDSGIDNIIQVAFPRQMNTPHEITEMMNDPGKSKSEGMVFKHSSAPYESGRPNSGGTQLKLKFTNDITVRIAARSEGKRSVAMELLHDGFWTGVGNVTIPPNRDIPGIGDLVDVNYLYAYPEGALYQPIFRGLRSDYDADECTTEKLVYKPIRTAVTESPEPDGF